MWNNLKWNWVNISAIAAFCLLPVIGLASDNSGDGRRGALASLTAFHDGASDQTASFVAPTIAH
jgi:hypothetical protein